MSPTSSLGVGMVGYAFMGRAHSQAWRTVDRVFDLPLRPRLAAICGRDRAATEAAADRLGWAAAGRGSGVVDMVRAIRRGQPHRASGEMAQHVLEMMTAIERSAATSSFEPVQSVFDPPDALAEDWDPYVAAA